MNGYYEWGSEKECKGYLILKKPKAKQRRLSHQDVRLYFLLTLIVHQKKRKVESESKKKKRLIILFLKYEILGNFVLFIIYYL